MKFNTYLFCRLSVCHPDLEFRDESIFLANIRDQLFCKKGMTQSLRMLFEFHTHTHHPHFWGEGLFNGRAMILVFFSEAVCVQFSQGSVYHFGNPHAIEMNFVGALLALFSTSLAVPSIRDDTTSLSPEAECLSWNETHFILSCFAKIQKYTKVL